MYLDYGICKVPIAPLKAENSHRSEMVSQVLFGEKLWILEVSSDNRWAKVLLEWDDYTGWLNIGQIQLLPKKIFEKELKYISGKHNCLLYDEHAIMPIPIGSSLPEIVKGCIKVITPPTFFKGKKIKLIEQTSFGKDLVNMAMEFYGAPYLWGGRSTHGIDCSGLVQMAYKLCNVKIPRDASQQVEIGKEVAFLEEAQAGDLAFFDNEEGRVTHVGILLNRTEIIHATEYSGRVVIDTIDTGGIINRELKKRTHQLRVIRRVIDIIDYAN